ncbi:conserved Plasmodium protein, unknown function [Plasmodium sp. gorilla clade G2]|uniref:conserved Plasmodium protein, unknown function n=1 Tax=Plasmodium sp. gorilla clade G2 TaxID=880535 RepID=UPI000D226B60|nr:conserved Plasmodium protein, unknown function [Plasmodium sp. gorilla clade G2]SOV15111.1 conserved Plasmodium protein, unknown function [Plasmodium sp. gorilla clade G2]
MNEKNIEEEEVENIDDIDNVDDVDDIDIVDDVDDVIYEGIENKKDIIDISSDDEDDEELYNNSTDDNNELIKYKEKYISYEKKFYTNKSIYCVNSFKKWIYFGSINNKCYLYNNVDDNLKNYILSTTTHNNNYNNSNYYYDNINFTDLNNKKINLSELKHQIYSDTITNIKFSRNFQYVGLSIYNGDIYIYENNNDNGSEIMNYNLNNMKKNINNSNGLLDIFNWDIEKKKTNEYIVNENMKLINILSINNDNEKKDLEYSMFCLYHEHIFISIYVNCTNIYVWNVLEGTPINIIHTTQVPTFINLCNYDNKFYMIAGFNTGQTCVYDYDIYNVKRVGQIQGGKYVDSNKNVHDNTNTNSINNYNNSYYNDDDINDGVLCIDNNLANEIYICTYKNIINIYNINNNNLINTYKNLHNDLIDCCLFNNKKYNLFASCSLDNKINIYDFQHNKSINQFYVNYHFNEPDQNQKTEKGINFLRWINTNLLLFTSLNGNIYIYDIRSRQCIHQFYSHTDTIFNVNLSLHLYQHKNILSILTASDDNSSNMHFFDISPHL